MRCGFIFDPLCEWFDSNLPLIIYHFCDKTGFGLRGAVLLIRKAVVLAAGKGTRLMPLTLAMPKEMIRVGVKPVIEHAIEVLKAGGIRDILVVVGRKKEAIMDYLGSFYTQLKTLGDLG